jgi:hypothetical protein
MWTTLVCAAALTLGADEGGQLQLSNERLTYGVMGAERTDSQFLAGDIFWLTADIENLKSDKIGKVKYTLKMEIRNEKGELVFGRDNPQELEALLSLGNGRAPIFPNWEIPPDTPPGEYTLKVTVTDKAAKKTKSLTRKFEIVPKKFGLIRLTTVYNFRGFPPAPGFGVAGQSFVVNFAATDFARDRSSKQPSVAVEMRIFDDKNRPTVPEPFPGGFDKDVPENLNSMDMQFLLELNRPGKFVVKLKAVDKIGTKTAEVSFPITVVEGR